MKKQKQGAKPSEFIAIAFFEAVMVVLPLYMENRYFNILEAKASCYKVIVLFFLCLFLLFGVWRASWREYFRLNRLDFLVMLYCGLTLLSSVCSESFSEAFWGTQGWSVGAFVIIASGILYLFFSRSLRYRHNMWIPVLVVGIFISLITVIQAAEIDIFHLYKNVQASLRFDYMATIGHRNAYVGYLCLTVPAMLIFYLSSESKESDRIYLFYFIPVIFSMIICASDGIFPGLGLCAIFGAPYILVNRRQVQKLFLLIGIYGAALLLIGVCPWYERMRFFAGGISGRILTPGIGFAFLLAGTVGWLWTEIYKKRKKVLRVPSRCAIVIVEMVLLGMAAGFLIHTILTFSDSWGTQRGEIWRVSLEVFSGLSLKGKLFGVGPEMLRDYYAEMSGHLPQIVLVSHSEPIQVLLTMGIFGIVTWSLLWVVLIVEYFNKKLWQKREIAFFLPLIAYLGQSFVNSPTVLNTAVFYVMLGCYRQLCYRDSYMA